MNFPKRSKGFTSMDRITIPIKQLDKSLSLPSYAYAGDAGIDLCSTIDCTLQPHVREVIPCGIALAIPEGFAGFVLPRSGLAAKHGLSLVNAPGLIDSGYRGEIQVVLINLDTSQPYLVHRGDRIAQLVIMQVPAVNLSPVDELPTSARGKSGFGSSGVSS